MDKRTIQQVQCACVQLMRRTSQLITLHQTSLASLHIDTLSTFYIVKLYRFYHTEYYSSPSLLSLSLVISLSAASRTRDLLTERTKTLSAHHHSTISDSIEDKVKVWVDHLPLLPCRRYCYSSSCTCCCCCCWVVK